MTGTLQKHYKETDKRGDFASYLVIQLVRLAKHRGFVGCCSIDFVYSLDVEFMKKMLMGIVKIIMKTKPKYRVLNTEF